MKVKIKITNSTIADGKHVDAGKIIDVEAGVARELFIAGKAVPVDDKPEKPMVKKAAGKKPIPKKGKAKK